MAEPEAEKTEKTELEKSKDILSQLKEMEHYSKANIEKLTEIWLLFDGEMKQKAMAKKTENVLTHQNTVQDALAEAITDFEAVCNKLEAEAPASPG
jgi:hypothetical protein